MKLIISIIYVFIMLPSIIFAQENNVNTSLSTDRIKERNILWLNVDFGRIKKLDEFYDSDQEKNQKEQKKYYSLGFKYDYCLAQHFFCQFGANFSTFTVQSNYSEYDTNDLFILNKSRVLTFDPSIGIRMITHEEQAKFRAFFDIGIYSSLLRVHTKRYTKNIHHLDEDYRYDSSQTFYEGLMYGPYTGLGVFYKFTNNVCSTISFNLKIPFNGPQRTWKYDNEYYAKEYEGAQYNPLFYGISFSIGYLL